MNDSKPYSNEVIDAKLHSYDVSILEETNVWGPDDHRGFMIKFSDGQSIFIDSENDPKFHDVVKLAGNVKIESIQYFSGCLFAGTKITMYDGSEKNVEDIQIGDKILSYDPNTLKLSEDIVTYSDAQLHQTSNQGYDIWRFDNGTIVKTVERHRFYNYERQAMVYLDEWHARDQAIMVNGMTTQLYSHEHIDGTFEHYTLFTKNQNYFANGLLSGNRYTKTMYLK